MLFCNVSSRLEARNADRQHHSGAAALAGDATGWGGRVALEKCNFILHAFKIGKFDSKSLKSANISAAVTIEAGLDAEWKINFCRPYWGGWGWEG